MIMFQKIADLIWVILTKMDKNQYKVQKYGWKSNNLIIFPNLWNIHKILSIF